MLKLNPEMKDTNKTSRKERIGSFSFNECETLATRTLRSKSIDNTKNRKQDDDESLSINSKQKNSYFLSESDKIGLIISKGKKAAASLWTILHAQNCRKTQSCSHPGCYETKLILLHIKTCNVDNGVKCNHPGCHETKKLLAHYRRCRSSRQRTNKPCLVCTFLSQHAKSYLEKCKACKNSKIVRASSTRKLNEDIGNMPPPAPRIPSRNATPLNCNNTSFIYQNGNVCSKSSLSFFSENGRTKKRTASLDESSSPSSSSSTMENDPTLEIMLTRDFEIGTGKTQRRKLLY